MQNELTTQAASSATLPAAQVYGMAVICLVMGLGIGYIFRDSQMQATSVQVAGRSTSQVAAATSGQASAVKQGMGAMGQMPVGGAAQSPHAMSMGSKPPSLADMKQMADSKAAPLLEKLKNDPNNADLLNQVGAIYHATHQFKDSAIYYDKSVQVDPKNVATRTKLAISMYRSGDVDGAIAQLNRALSYDAKDANALFDMGMIRLEAKQDRKGALAAWRELLKSNPELSAERKAAVQKMISDVQANAEDQSAAKGAQSK
jgi:cytochrome c-type biogenesis protein CcmH/NrfG